MSEKEKNLKALNARPELTNWAKSKSADQEKKVGPADMEFPDDFLDTKTVGRYKIIKKLGQGSSGVVYLGKDPYIGRNVGIKIYRHAVNLIEPEANDYRKNFFIEAQLAGSLLHQNIVGIYDAGVYKNFCYITMEYVDGPTLNKYCNKGSLMPVINVVQNMYLICKALDHAHKNGVIHRDIKPSNIMLNKAGQIKITDFGIAKIKSAQIDSEGTMGSPSYMSPEQLREEPVYESSDIFSLGCVLYELLTGKKAFPGDNFYSIMYKVIGEEPVNVQEIHPYLPEVLVEITKKALAKDAGKRYQTCSELAYALRVALKGLRGAASKKSKLEDIIDYVHSVPFFDRFTKDQVKEVLDISEIVKVAKKKIVVAEGNIDDSFFIILSGNVEVQKNGKAIAFIGRGECFGEIAYLSGRPRSATVVARTDCSLMKISATLLDRCSESIQLLLTKEFAMTLLRRLSKSAS